VRQLDRSAPGADIARAGSARRFDCWAADYDTSQLQTVLYGPVHEAVLRYARLHIPRPGRILDVGCGTGRLPARIVSAYQEAQVVGVDASTEMIKMPWPRRIFTLCATYALWPNASLSPTQYSTWLWSPVSRDTAKQ
jgi:SAM-dependent methyltransferase